MLIKPMLQKKGGGGLSSGTVLWENPNPTAAFASQTVTLSQSYKIFKYIGMRFRQNEGYGESIVPKETLDMEQGGYKGTVTIGYKLVIGSDYWYARNGYMTDETHMRISTMYRAGSSSNSELIPTQILGYN